MYIYNNYLSLYLQCTKQKTVVQLMGCL